MDSTRQQTPEMRPDHQVSPVTEASIWSFREAGVELLDLVPNGLGAEQLSAVVVL